MYAGDNAGAGYTPVRGEERRRDEHRTEGIGCVCRSMRTGDNHSERHERMTWCDYRTVLTPRGASSVLVSSIRDGAHGAQLRLPHRYSLDRPSSAAGAGYRRACRTGENR